MRTTQMLFANGNVESRGHAAESELDGSQSGNIGELAPTVAGTDHLVAAEGRVRGKKPRYLLQQWRYVRYAFTLSAIDDLRQFRALPLLDVSPSMRLSPLLYCCWHVSSTCCQSLSCLGERLTRRVPLLREMTLPQVTLLLARGPSWRRAFVGTADEEQLILGVMPVKATLWKQSAAGTGLGEVSSDGAV